MTGIDRAVARVPFQVRVRDEQFFAGSDEQVSLRLEFRVGDAQFHPATLTDDSTRIVTQSGDYDVGWDAIEDANSTTLLDENDGALLPVDVELRVVATDRTGLNGDAVFSLTVGNSAPTVVFDDEVQSLVAGPVPLVVSVFDTSADLADIELEFRDALDTVWRRGSLEPIGRTNVQSLPEMPGGAALVVWNSDSPPNVDPTIPQGVGEQTRSGVQVRVRGMDSVDGRVFVGEWSPPLSLGIVRNQVAPEIVSLSVLRGGGGGADSFLVEIVLADENHDPVDLLFEYSFDGDSWLPFQELPRADSAGLREVPTTSRLEGGLTHRIWLDAQGQVFSETPALLRVRATDRRVFGDGVQLAEFPPTSIGLLGDRQALVPVQRFSCGSVCPFISEVVVADVNEDSVADLVTAGGEPAEVQVFLGSELEPSLVGLGWSGDDIPTVLSGNGIGNSLVVDDVTGDGIVDLLTFPTEGQPELRVGVNDGGDRQAFLARRHCR